MIQQNLKSRVHLESRFLALSFGKTHFLTRSTTSRLKHTLPESCSTLRLFLQETDSSDLSIERLFGRHKLPTHLELWRQGRRENCRLSFLQNHMKRAREQVIL